MHQSLYVQCTGLDHVTAQMEFHQYPVHIGRDPASQIVLDAQGVSRCHAVIDCTDGVWVLSDVQSTNGTYVNDCLTEYSVVHAGDLIRIGPYRLTVAMEYQLEESERADGAGGALTRSHDCVEVGTECPTLKTWHEGST